MATTSECVRQCKRRYEENLSACDVFDLGSDERKVCKEAALAALRECLIACFARQEESRSRKKGGYGRLRTFGVLFAAAAILAYFLWPAGNLPLAFGQQKNAPRLHLFENQHALTIWGDGKGRVFAADNQVILRSGAFGDAGTWNQVYP